MNYTRSGPKFSKTDFRFALSIKNMHEKVYFDLITDECTESYIKRIVMYADDSTLQEYIHLQEYLTHTRV